jgi:hypothetical protein
MQPTLERVFLTESAPNGDSRPARFQHVRCRSEGGKRAFLHSPQAGNWWCWGCSKVTCLCVCMWPVNVVILNLLKQCFCNTLEQHKRFSLKLSCLLSGILVLVLITWKLHISSGSCMLGERFENLLNPSWGHSEWTVSWLQIPGWTVEGALLTE